LVFLHQVFLPSVFAHIRPGFHCQGKGSEFFPTPCPGIIYTVSARENICTYKTARAAPPPLSSIGFIRAECGCCVHNYPSANLPFLFMGWWIQFFTKIFLLLIVDICSVNSNNYIFLSINHMKNTKVAVVPDVTMTNIRG
jgi:hypothetical protein